MKRQRSMWVSIEFDAHCFFCFLRPVEYPFRRHVDPAAIKAAFRLAEIESERLKTDIILMLLLMMMTMLCFFVNDRKERERERKRRGEKEEEKVIQLLAAEMMCCSNCSIELHHLPVADWCQLVRSGIFQTGTHTHTHARTHTPTHAGG